MSKYVGEKSAENAYFLYSNFKERDNSFKN